jgi:hypothetical protein
MTTTIEPDTQIANANANSDGNGNGHGSGVATMSASSSPNVPPILTRMATKYAFFYLRFLCGNRHQTTNNQIGGYLARQKILMTSIV